MEDKTTEYEVLDLGVDGTKKKFLAGIASFTNARGGDFYLRQEGRPVGLYALDGFNPDRPPSSFET